jgi:primosomal protein N' (replication factor Y) (superfamily II helicase)
MTILRLALPTPLRRLFDYLPVPGVDCAILVPGIRVRVPFQSRRLVGILVEIVQKTDIPLRKLKKIIEIIDAEPIIDHDINKLCHFAADYYHYALGEVYAAAIPTLLRQGKDAIVKKKSILLANTMGQCTEPLTLNDDQEQAVRAVYAKKDQFQVYLLDGVTGSGKTEIYLQIMAHMLAQNKQILVLIPEISLTPQTVKRFSERFKVPVVSLHSNLSDADRLSAWVLAKSNQASIVIGTRSAIFTPFRHLGLIIVDEEHDSSFKQQDRFRYHARDLAIFRARLHNIPIVLGSATPSVESFYNAKINRYQYLSLPTRAGKAQLPDFQLIDVRQSPAEHGLSKVLLQAITKHLAAGNQVLLFLNRRGFAPVIYCPQCAWIAGCKRCDMRMVYHRKDHLLKCHHCNAKRPMPKACDLCSAPHLQILGLGTERLEQALAEYFKDIPLIRVDRDNTKRKGAMHELLQQIHDHPCAILLGTQMLAKGHHFPNVTLVGIIDADCGLFSADLRAAEQMGQLLLQVAGRAGRADKPGTVMVQTKFPKHDLLQLLIAKGYLPFVEQLLTERALSEMPPYSFLALIRAESLSQERAREFLEQVRSITISGTDDIELLGPISATIAKRKGCYSQLLLLKSKKRMHLQYYLRLLVPEIEKIPNAHHIRWVLDVDPLEVL